MQYRAFDWHSGSATRLLRPRSTTGNIKGVELEISGHHRHDQQMNDKLDEMVDKGILTVPNINIGRNIASPTLISNDSSVFKELIIKACSRRPLLQSIKTLSDELSDITNNRRGTSCHIHYNDRYLHTKNLRSYDLFKCAEFLGPILYRISEREEQDCDSYARSYIGELDNPNLYERGKKIDFLTGEGRQSRYSIINCRDGSDTTELRIFSNHCNFDYNTIKFYIDTSDFLVELSEYMINKSYEEESENIVKMCKKFFTKKNTIQFYNKYNLEEFFKSKKEFDIEKLTALKQKIINDFRRLNFANEMDEYEKRIRLCRILRNINSRHELSCELEINFEENDIERNREILITTIEEDIENL